MYVRRRKTVPTHVTTTPGHARDDPGGFRDLITDREVVAPEPSLDFSNYRRIRPPPPVDHPSLTDRFHPSHSSLESLIPCSEVHGEAVRDCCKFHPTPGSLLTR